MADSAQEQACGVLQIVSRGNGFLRDPALFFQPSPADVRVPARLIREAGLVEGAAVCGPVRSGKRGPQLAAVASICGLDPAEFQARTRFENLVAIDPNQRFRLGESDLLSMRIVELVAPIGKGTRGLIVAPPQAGKTQVLQELAAAIHAADTDSRILLLLIDERPEEVTHFRRAVPGEVLASSSDSSIDAHVALAKLTMAHVRVELECGRNVVLLVDSLTRLVRAFNLHGTGARRTLSGGVDAKALEIPRQLFGLARNVENGGSVTVLATALIETGSRMDDYVFEEFKSTGNSEIVLDRELAESRIFPAVNVHASGTRREELLYSEAEMQRLAALRRWLAGGSAKAAIRGLLKLMAATKSNEELLLRIKKS